MFDHIGSDIVRPLTNKILTLSLGKGEKTTLKVQLSHMCAMLCFEVKKLV